MATVNVYDEVSGLTRIVTVDIASAVVNGLHTGSQAYYVTVSTSAKDPSGGVVPRQRLIDGDINDNISTALKPVFVELFKHILGTYLSSSSSSSASNSESSLTIGTSSQSSTSSASTQHVFRSSSSSSSGLSSKSSSSESSSLSTASSTYSAHPEYSSQSSQSSITP